jgi:hypothetical protein
MQKHEKTTLFLDKDSASMLKDNKERRASAL